ncbi:hypothetical protein GJAV_G00006170 [Gymnothorax javanicus]|nr:hypothetical protein GJAV_G00006170 [Gymnothorax javanicus]
MPVPIGWVLIGLCFGTLVLAETEAEFSECSQSFYKQTPPVGFSGGELQPRCHSLSAGRTFASLYSTSCDSTVFSAFCLHKTWGETDEHTETGTEEMEESQTAEEDLPATPALLKRDGHNVYTSSGSPTDTWDALVSELIKNNIHPQCQSLGGDLYVLTGKGGAEDVGQGCELDLLWSAMCCAVLDDEVVFSLGIVKDGEGEARVLDVNGLAEAVGVGVEESAPQPEHVDAAAESSLAESAETSSSPSPSEEEEDESAGVLSRRSAPLSASQESSTTQAAEESRAAPQGNSTILYLLSYSLWLLSTPVRPVTSTLTKIPGQVTHVIREDLAVLSTLPGDTLSLVNNVAADTYRGVSSAVGLVGRAGSTCASCLYSCASPLVGALLSTCQDGVMGVGTLTWDGVGIFGGVLNRAWSVTKYFGGRTWEQSEGFLWAVLSELGNQSKRAGGGLGKLAFRGGKGVVNTVCMAGRIVWGTLATTVEMVKEVFGDD